MSEHADDSADPAIDKALTRAIDTMLDGAILTVENGSLVVRSGQNDVLWTGLLDELDNVPLANLTTRCMARAQRFKHKRLTDADEPAHV